MAVTGYYYARALVNAFGGSAEGTSYAFDYLTNTIKVALTTSTYTPNQDTHDFFDDVTNEVVGSGYTAGGATLGSKTLSNTNNVVSASDYHLQAGTSRPRRSSPLVLASRTSSSGRSLIRPTSRRRPALTALCTGTTYGCRRRASTLPALPLIRQWTAVRDCWCLLETRTT